MSLASGAVVVSTPITSPGAAGTPDTLAGNWTGIYASSKYPTVKGTFHATFVVTGPTFTGTVQISTTCVPQGTLSGTLKGSQITFGAVHGAETVTFTGTIAGTHMTGTYHSGPSCGADNGTWSADQ